MRKPWRGVILTAALPLLAASAAAPAAAQEALGEGMTIYMQMGGTEGDGATLPRTNGARAAAQALGVSDLIEQYSGWLPEQMLDHFREAPTDIPRWWGRYRQRLEPLGLIAWCYRHLR
jgi:simple sugar transport system substrate-binding protein